MENGQRREAADGLEVHRARQSAVGGKGRRVVLVGNRAALQHVAIYKARCQQRAVALGRPARERVADHKCAPAPKNGRPGGFSEEMTAFKPVTC